MGLLLIVVALVLLIYLFLIRPRQSQLRKQQRQADALRLGDEVVTAGGIYGTVKRLDGDEVRVEIAPELEVRVARRAIAGVLTEPVEEQEAEEVEEHGEREAQGQLEAGEDLAKEQAQEPRENGG